MSRGWIRVKVPPLDPDWVGRAALWNRVNDEDLRLVASVARQALVGRMGKGVLYDRLNDALNDGKTIGDDLYEIHLEQSDGDELVVETSEGFEATDSPKELVQVCIENAIAEATKKAIDEVRELKEDLRRRR